MTATEVTTPTRTEKALTDIDDMVRGLAQLRQWIEAHPEVGGHLSGDTFIIADWYNHEATPADLVRAIKDGAPIGAMSKTAGRGDLETTMFIERQFAGGVKIQYQAVRDEVCVRRVVGTEKVQVPDPSAPLVEVEREVIEWDCAPILGGAA